MVYIQSLSKNTEFVKVTFELPGKLWAVNVALAGDFNGWNKRSLSLHQERDGRWRLRMLMPTNRRHLFCYVVDDMWCCEPSAPCVQAHIPSAGSRTVCFLDTWIPRDEVAA